MARTAVDKKLLVANGFLADPTGTALDATNHHTVAAPLEDELVLLRVTNSYAGSKAITVKAGVGPLAGQGDYTPAGLAQNAVGWYGPFTSAKFGQADGSINVDCAASMTGYIQAFIVPRNA
jgi:hypothetical protein